MLLQSCCSLKILLIQIVCRQLFDNEYFLRSFNLNWGWVRDSKKKKKRQQNLKKPEVGTDIIYSLIGDQGLHRALLSS